jgi:type 2A phosphatase activator TIP41
MNLPFPFEKHTNGISIGEWKLTVKKSSISNNEEIEIFEKHSNLRCPEMTFLENTLSVENMASGFSIHFCGREALQAVRATPSEVKVQDSAKWTGFSVVYSFIVDLTGFLAGRTCDNMVALEEKFDWTYTSEYKGTISPSIEQETSQSEFPMSLITRQDMPILWYAILWQNSTIIVIFIILI